jgi:hypothetical protein
MNQTDFTTQLQCDTTAVGIEEDLPSNLADTLLAITKARNARTIVGKFVRTKMRLALL